MAMTDYLENALISEVLRGVNFASPSTVYVALFTSATTDAGGGTEVSGGSYSRKSAVFSSPSNGVTSNSSQIVFTTATASWGTVTHFAIYDASSGGNMLLHGALDNSKAIDTDDSLVFEAGNLSVTFA